MTARTGMRSSAELRGRRVFIPIALAAFITSLDTTVVTTAQPSIMKDLHLTLSGLEWVATSYVLMFASLLLVGGRLTDLIGRRTVLLAGVVIFGFASVLVALAPGIGVLLAGRSLQGAGAALVMPAVLAILGADVNSRDRHLGAGIYTVAIGSSLALGPFVGGAISQFLHWTFIFWLNVPVVLITCATVVWAVPPSPAAFSIRRSGLRELLGRLDLGGMILASLTLAAVTFALIEGQKLGYGSPVVLIALVVAAIALPLAVVVGQGSAHPLLQLDLLRHPVVLGGAGIQVLWGLGINGVFFFTSIFLQKAMGMTPSTAGLAFVPLAVSLILIVPVSAWLASTWGAHRAVALGMVVVAAGLVAITFAGPGDGMPQLLPGLILIGAGTALTTPLTSAVLEKVPPGRVGMVSAVISVSREISGVLGIAVTGAVLTLRESGAIRGGATPDDAFVAGYRTGLLVGAVLALSGVYIALRTLRPGQAMLADYDSMHSGGSVSSGTPEPSPTDGTPAGVAALVIDVRDEVILPGHDLSADLSADLEAELETELQAHRPAWDR